MLFIHSQARDVARAAQDLAAKEAIEQAKRKGAQAIWEAKVQQVKKQEQEALDEAALPLRTFLMRHVMPTLTEVCHTYHNFANDGQSSIVGRRLTESRVTIRDTPVVV